EYQLHEWYYPYTICARLCVEQATAWRDIHWPTVPIEYIFECGDPHRGQLRDTVYAKWGVEPIFRNRDTVPLQVADFAAYEVLKMYRRLSVETKSYTRQRASHSGGCGRYPHAGASSRRKTCAQCVVSPTFREGTR